MKRHMTFVTESKPNKANEDLLGCCEDVFWLLDGASIPNEWSRCLSIDTNWYVNQLSKEIALAVKQRKDLALQEYLRSAITRVRSTIIQKGIQLRAVSMMPSSTVVLVRLYESCMEYLVLGDSYLSLCGGSQKQWVTDHRLKRVAQDIRNEMRRSLLRGEGFYSDQWRSLKKQLLLTERMHRNRKNGYWIAAEEPGAANHAIHGKISLSSQEEYTILLMSDGFARAVTTLQLFPTWSDLHDYIQKKGLYHCLRLIRRREFQDAHGQLFPRSSRHDDASALWIQLFP